MENDDEYCGRIAFERKLFTILCLSHSSRFPERYGSDELVYTHLLENKPVIFVSNQLFLSKYLLFTGNWRLNLLMNDC